MTVKRSSLVGMQTKSVRAEFKASTKGSVGRVEALVAVFNNVDLHRDRILPGAFTDTLAEWNASGDPIPFIWSHDWWNPQAHIGKIIDAEETPAGLKVIAENDLDREFAADCHRLLVERRVKEFSFGYFVKASQDATDDAGAYVRDLTALDLIEAGPCLVGMNPATELLQAASALGLRVPPGADLGADTVGAIQKAVAEAVEQVLREVKTIGEAPIDDPDDGAAGDAGDSTFNIDTNRLSDLLTSTRHTGGVTE